MKRFLLFSCLFGLMPDFGLAQGTPVPASTAAPTEEPDSAGKVELIEGDARVFDKAKKLRQVKVGDPVFEGDSIVTGQDGEVHLAMGDGGYIGVRPGTKMRIVNYRAQGDADDKALFGLLEGSFRSITGWIARFGPKNYVIRTPTATIGVRGTDHEPSVIPEGSTLGEPGTYDKVNIGGTFLNTPQGRVDIEPGKAGFAPRRGGVRPRLLERVPAFFKPTRNEQRFEGLHERIQKQLQERRGQRQKFIRERRQRLGKKKAEHVQERTAVQQEKRHEFGDAKGDGRRATVTLREGAKRGSQERLEHGKAERLQRLQERPRVKQEHRATKASQPREGRNKERRIPKDGNE
ncbi:MAG: FecR domain-containing protein [Burkholderiales bacterium]